MCTWYESGSNSGDDEYILFVLSFKDWFSTELLNKKENLNLVSIDVRAMMNE